MGRGALLAASLLALLAAAASHATKELHTECGERGCARVFRPAAAAAGVAVEVPAAGAVPTVHTVVATDCTRYFTWQTMGLAFSHRRSGMPGPLTRLMSCTAEDWEALPEEDRALAASLPIRTHRAPSYSVHPRTGDVYPGINKPVAVIDWLAHTEVEEDWVLIIDADMVLRRPILPTDYGATKGTAVSGFFGYMIGVNNELALRHVPEVEPRTDTRAGPEGRRGDQVGGFALVHAADLRRLAPLWLTYSEAVREDPLAWNLTGDAYAKEGDKPWIAEMYGYSFGAAKADVWHVAAPTAQLYPGYGVGREHFEDPPRALHYGILWDVAGANYSFDKHWHYDFNALACPPWDMSDDPRLTKRGLFAHPPRPSAFGTTGAELFRDLLAIEVPITLNAAFCERHRRDCPPSEELERECGRAEALLRELQQAYAALEPPPDSYWQQEAQGGAGQDGEQLGKGERAAGDGEPADGGREAAAGVQQAAGEERHAEHIEL